MGFALNGYKVKDSGYGIQFMTTTLQDRYVTHFQGESSQPPMGLAEHILWLEGQLAGVPAEHRASAELEYEAPESCEQSNGWLYIRYRRPETPEECAERMAALRQRAEARRAASEAYKLWANRLAAQMQATAQNPAK